MLKIKFTEFSENNKGGIYVFPNLKAEMARKEIGNDAIAKVLGINISTVSAKLNIYDRLKFCEAQKIQHELFPECTVDYLFAI